MAAGIEELLRIMARLRDPERGCPWDLDQDFASISPHTIEEAYEVDEAIHRGDLPALQDELGDLLFQVVFQARLGEEQGAFDFAAVVDGICRKLVRRHPHIFSDAPAPGSATSQLASWEAIKAAERAAARTHASDPIDPFEGIPRALPALTRSAKLAGRMAGLEIAALERVASAGALPAGGRAGGRDLRSAAAIAGALRGVASAADRAAAALRPDAARTATSTADTAPVSAASRADFLALVGEGIRAWVELARQLGVDPEQALRLKDDETIAAVRSDVRQGGSSRHR